MPIKIHTNFSLKHFLNTYGPLLALAALVCFMNTYVPEKFSTIPNLKSIINTAIPLTLLATAITIVFISAKIDLSLPALLAMTITAAPIISAKLTALNFSPGTSTLLTILVILTISALSGFINATLTTRLKAPSALITITTFTVLIQIKGFLNNLTKTTQPLPDLQNLLVWPTQVTAAPYLPYAIYIIIVLAILTAAALNLTSPGKHIIATGANEKIARYAGIKTNLSITFAFITAALLTGSLAIIMLTDPQTKPAIPSLEMIFIPFAAPILAGANPKGGKASITATIIATALLATILNTIEILNSPQWLIQTAPPIVLITALTLRALQNPKAQ